MLIRLRTYQFECISVRVADKTDRDVAAAQVIRNRGVTAVGHIVVENACGDGLAGADLVSLAKSPRSRKSQL